MGDVRRRNKRQFAALRVILFAFVDDKLRQGGTDRLDSWKAIAAHLQRDQRTVQRWERELGLPVRRMPGRGRSVYAFASEIDAWLKTSPPEEPATVAPAPPLVPHPVRRSTPRWPVVLAGAAIVAGLVAWRFWPARLSAANLRVTVTPAGVAAADASGSPLWSYPFPSSVRTALAEEMNPGVQVVDAGHPAVYVATAYSDRRPDEARESGRLIELGLDGRLRRSFAFTDSVTVGGSNYHAPWIITAFAVDDSGGARRIAVAAHHAIWHVSLVTVLDDRWQRRGTFEHAGWIEGVHWLAPDRLAIAGFSNARDGGMVALLDTSRPAGIDGQGPEAPGSPFFCSSCPTGAPLRVAVMPRTALNRATASRFNRARIEVTGDRLFVHTIEVEDVGGVAVDAVYEFTRSLDFVRAAFGDHYWEAFDLLRSRGQLKGPDVQPAARSAPPSIDEWTPQTGWRTRRTR